MSRSRVALIVGLALLAAGVLVALLRSPMSVARSNGVSAEAIVSETRSGTSFCQPRELVPRETSAIRISLSAYTGPRIAVTVHSGSEIVTRGTAGSGWTGRVVTVPVDRVRGAVGDATVCAAFKMRDEEVTAYGARAPVPLRVREDGRVLGGRLRIEYLRPGNRTWASLAPSIIRHIGLGRAGEGIGLVLLAIALLLAVIALTVSELLRELP